MNNFNLKYFAIAIIALSVLIVVGAFIFSLLSKPKITSSPTQQSEATQSAIPNPLDNGGPGGEK